MHRTILLTILATACSLLSFSQFTDSIKSSLACTPRPVVKLDARNSFITAGYAKIFGVKAGVDFNNTFELGVGFSRLATSLVRNVNFKYLDGLEELTPSELTFQYISIYADYTFYRKNKWTVQIPVMLGVGSANYKPVVNAESYQKRSPTTVMVYEPYMIWNYNIIKYVNLGIGGGYRVLILGNKKLGENFHSPIYILKINFAAGELIRDIYPGN